MSVISSRPGGIRLRHPFFKSGTLTIEHRGRPYKLPFKCPMCKKEHVVKTYHLHFDGEGLTIVSPEVYDRLKELGALAGFQVFGDDGLLSYVDDVREPPKQVLSMDSSFEGTRIFRVRLGDQEMDDGAPDYRPLGPPPMPTFILASPFSIQSGIIVPAGVRVAGE